MYGSSYNTPRPKQALYHGTTVDKGGRNPFAGNMFCNTDLVDPQKLEYNRKRAVDQFNQVMNTTDSRTFIRILPTRDDFNPDQLAPPVHPGLKIGQWLRSYNLFMGGQLKQVKFIAYDPNDVSYSSRTNPVEVMRRNIKMEVEAGRGRPGWEKLVFSDQELNEMRKAAGALGVSNPQFGAGGDGEDATNKYYAPLDFPRRTYFIRALVIQRGRRLVRPIQGLAEDDKLPLLVMSSTVGPQLAADVMQHGYDFQFEGGTFHCIYRDGDEYWKQDQFIAKIGNEYKVARCGPNWPYPGTDFTSADLTPYADLLFRKLVPWKDVLYVYEDEDQARFLAEAFPWEVCDRAWREYPHYHKIAWEIHHRTTTVEASNGLAATVTTVPQTAQVAPDYHATAQTGYPAPASPPEDYPVAAPVGYPASTAITPQSGYPAASYPGSTAAASPVGHPAAVPVPATPTAVAAPVGYPTAAHVPAIPVVATIPVGYPATGSVATASPPAVPPPDNRHATQPVAPISPPSIPGRQQWQPPAAASPAPSTPIPPAVMPGSPDNTKTMQALIAAARAAVQADTARS